MPASTTTEVVSFLDALAARYGAEDDINSYDPSAFLVGDATRKRNKTWELVGMEKTRQKQSKFHTLVHVVLRQTGMSVALKEDEMASASSGELDKLSAAKMLRLDELDLSENTDLPLKEIAILLPYFPALTTLQLSDMPEMLLRASPSIVTLTSSRLTKLVLNNSGFRSIFQLRGLIELPALTELHLDSNNLDGLHLFADEAEQAEAMSDGKSVEEVLAALVMPTVTTLSLAHNAIASWGSATMEMPEAGTKGGLGWSTRTVFPSLTHLFLTDNKLPSLMWPRDDGHNVDDLEFLRPLRLLCLKDNAAITHPSTVDAIRALCPVLEVCRITYEYLLPTWNETLARMFVVASLPTITLLNRGQVRPKERLDSEIFYVQRGLAVRERAAANPASTTDAEEVAYPLLDELLEKHKDLVLSVYREGTTASSDGISHMMLNVTLHCVNTYKAKAKGEESELTTTRKSLPSSLTVGKLKALVHVTFQVDPVHQSLSYRTGDAGVLQAPIPLDNETQTLAYYGICDGAVIHITDTSLR